MRILTLAAGALLAASQLASAQAPTPPVPVAATSTSHFIKLADEAKLSSNVVGLNVHNANKDNIGEIKDVAMDATGVRAYILSVGGFLGMGTHYVAVVPSQVNIVYDSTDKKWHATMNATKDELKAAPEFKYTGMWSGSKS